MMKKILIAGLFLVTVMATANADDNYCHDKASWAEWEQTVRKNPDDLETKTLYALRIGLCSLVDRRQLTVDQATSVFEAARQELIIKRQKENHPGKNKVPI